MDPLFVYGQLLTNSRAYLSSCKKKSYLKANKTHIHTHVPGKLEMDWMCYLPVNTTAHYQRAQVTALAVKQ